jgi:hypothetical protein
MAGVRHGEAGLAAGRDSAGLLRKHGVYNNQRIERLTEALRSVCNERLA